MENNNNIQENKMGVMPVNRLIITMSLPIIISMLIQALYNIVDSIFVAKISENALNAVSLAFPMQNLMIAVATGTGVGINALLSKSLGEKNQEHVDKTANTGIFLAFFSYLLFLLIGIFVTPFFFAGQTDIPEILELGNEYLTIVCCLSFGLFGAITFERLLQATGKSIYSMYAQAAGAIINIVLDPILIFGWLGFPEMGVAGAAIATIIGQICGCLLGLIFNLAINHDIHISLKNIIRPEMHIIKKIYAVGIPSIVMSSISSVTTYFINIILMSFTATATAVFGVYFKLQSFVFMPVFGLNNGMVPIIAYNYGAGNLQRIYKTIRLGIIYAVSIMLVGLLVMELFPAELLLMFEAQENMLAIGVPALRIISTSFVFAGFCIVCISVFQALGKSMYSLMISVVRQLIVLVPCAFLLSLSGVLDLVWLAFPIAEIAAVAVSIILLIRAMKKLKDRLPSNS